MVLEEAEMAHLPHLSHFDGLLDLLSLLNVVEFANVLHPATYGSGIQPDERLFLIHVRRCGREVLAWLDSLFEIADEMESIEDLAMRYRYRQALAIQQAKKFSDEVGIKHMVPGFTQEALEVQLAGCLGKEWGRESTGNVQSFALPARAYRVARKPVRTDSDSGMIC
jgi:hypothetical protein